MASVRSAGFDEFRVRAEIADLSANLKSIWYSVYVFLCEYPEVGDYGHWFQVWDADAALHWLVTEYAGPSVAASPMKSRILELCDAREGDRDRARSSRGSGELWNVTLQQDLIHKLGMSAFYALRPFSLARTQIEAGYKVPAKSSWHLPTFNKKVGRVLKGYFEQVGWEVDDTLHVVRMSTAGLEGALDLIMNGTCDDRFRWKGFYLDFDEWHTVRQQALKLYRQGVESVEQMEEDGLSTVVRGEPPFSMFRVTAPA